MLCPGEGIVIPKKSGTTKYIQLRLFIETELFYFVKSFVVFFK